MIFVTPVQLRLYDSIDFQNWLRDLVHKPRRDKGVITSHDNV